VYCCWSSNSSVPRRYRPKEQPGLEQLATFAAVPVEAHVESCTTKAASVFRIHPNFQMGKRRGVSEFRWTSRTGGYSPEHV